MWKFNKSLLPNDEYTNKLNKKSVTTEAFACCISSLKSAIKFISYKPLESGDIDFSNSHVTSRRSLVRRVMFGSLLR